jgi:hypothetical protein
MTAVEWLKNELRNTLTASIFKRLEQEQLFKQAKQMEDVQLKEMYLKGIENYDPTFKRKSQWTEVDNMTKRLK